MELADKTLTESLIRRDESAFEQVFKTYFKALHSYAFTMLRQQDEAEEIVQKVFFKLWERAANLNFSGSVSAYLYRAVHNECLNFIKHNKVRAAHQLHVVHRMKNQFEQDAPVRELEVKFSQALNDLPEQCRTIFQLSRFEELKYREIADKLGISIKTVENQMGKALKILRIRLVEFLPLICFFCQF